MIPTTRIYFYWLLFIEYSQAVKISLRLEIFLSEMHQSFFFNFYRLTGISRMMSTAFIKKCILFEFLSLMLCQIIDLSLIFSNLVHVFSLYCSIVAERHYSLPEKANFFYHHILLLVNLLTTNVVD